jgi:hypothetical protein
LLLFWDPGSEIRDPESGMGKNQDPGSGINIPDPQHCVPVMVITGVSLNSDPGFRRVSIQIQTMCFYDQKFEKITVKKTYKKSFDLHDVIRAPGEAASP